MVIINDPISDLITRIRNGLAVNKPYVLVPFSKLRLSVAETLKAQGYITDVSKVAIKQSNFEQLKLVLKYGGGRPVIQGLTRISKPGQRMYVPANRLERVLGGMGTAIVSTSAGIMTDHEARKAGLGGEVLFKVW